MKKRIIGFIIGIFSILSLSSCGVVTKNITKISEEAEYTKIENDITSVYETVSKGCVGVVVSNSSSSGSGSGVIYKYDSTSSKYYVVTNAHVVNGMTSCTIYFGNSKYNSAKIVGYDEKNDVAVLTFQLDLLNGKLKDSIYVNDIFNYEENDYVSVGQTALAIGCPLGINNFNVLTTGVVSTVSDLEVSVDAALNPGNSGGGLFNLEGRMIGLVSERDVWKLSTSHTGNTITTADTPIEGRGFCISMNIVKNCITAIEAKEGNITRPTLGIGVEVVNLVLSPNSIYKNILPQSNDVVFIVITSITNQSAAYKAGLEVNDVILEINDTKVSDKETIEAVLRQAQLSDTIKLKVYRSLLSAPSVVDIDVSFR